MRTYSVLVLVLLGSAGCTPMQIEEQEPEAAEAVQAQMAVKTALLEDGQIAAAPILVEYQAGSVLLSGYVETEDERQRAAEVARRVVPELEIVNSLEVWQRSD